MKQLATAATACGLGLLLVGCAQSPNARITDALQSNKAVIISPLLPTGITAWKLINNPDVEFQLGSETEAKTRIGTVYQMVVVEPGAYRLNASTSYAGLGKSQPGLVKDADSGRLGRVLLVNGSYREPYTVRIWQDRVTQQVVIPTTTYCASPGPNGSCQQWGYNQGGIINQVVQQEGYRNETRYKDPVSTLTIGLRYNDKDPLVSLEVKAGEVLLVNALEPTLGDIVYDDQHCSPDGELKHAYLCPFHRLRMGIPGINLDFFKQQAQTDPPIDPALLSKVRPYYLQLNGAEVGRNKDQWPIVEFGPKNESRPSTPVVSKTNAKEKKKPEAKPQK